MEGLGAVLLRCLAGLENFVRLPYSEVPERKDRRQVLGARTSLALLPVVDGLRRCADQEPALGCRESQALALRRHAPGAAAATADSRPRLALRR
jgi:hypothetical protein